MFSSNGLWLGDPLALDWAIEDAKQALACPHATVSFMPPNERRECWCCDSCHTTFTTAEVRALAAKDPESTEGNEH